MKNLIFRTLFVFSFVFFLFNTSANACSCGGSGPPCQSFGNTFAVFSGKVESITDSPREYSPVAGRKFNLIDKKVSFTVNESFRGISEKTVDVITSSQSSACGYRFEVGREYVVYAYKQKDGKLGTGICTRTSPIEKAQEDLQYFREIAKKPKDIAIYGGIFRVFTQKNDAPYRKPEPLANITLSLSNGEKAVTNEKGEFRFDKLLPQEYTLTPTVPSGLWGGDKPEYKLKLNPNGCAVASFAFVANTSLSGQVLDENANPAAEISVQLVPTDQINIHQSDLKMAFTDKNGRYIFHEIPTGDYYLGVRLFRIADILFPYPRTFYPNTLNLNEAKIISIKEGDVLKDFEIKLGQKLKQRVVSGIAVYPDGTPAANAMISAQETEYTPTSMGYAFQAKADGTFSITIIDGLRHIIKAVVADKKTYQQSHSEPIEISANGDVSNLKLIITEPNGNCSKCNPWKREPK
jgi:Tissue inhibitor of metalloproteinase